MVSSSIRRNVPSKSNKLYSALVFRASAVDGLPTTGTLALVPDYLCFFAKHSQAAKHILQWTRNIRQKIPLADIRSAHIGHGFRWHSFGVKLLMEGHADVRYELQSENDRTLFVGLLEERMALPALPEWQDTIEGEDVNEEGALRHLLKQDIIVPLHLVHKVNLSYRDKSLESH